MVWAWEAWYDQHVAIKEKRRVTSRVLPRCVHLGHVISRMAKRSYAAAWVRWLGHRGRSRVARKVLAKVMNLAVSEALSKWNEISIMATRMKIACGKSRSCISKRILKRSFFVWCIMNTETKKMEIVCSKIGARMRTSSGSRCLFTWNMNIKETKCMKILCTKLVIRVLYRKLSETLCTWQAMSKATSRMNIICSKSIKRMHYSVIFESYFAWHYKSVERKNLKRKMMLTSHRFTNKVLVQSMCFWQGIVQEARTARGVLEHDRLKMITIDGLATKFQTESQLWQVCMFS